MNFTDWVLSLFSPVFISPFEFPKLPPLKHLHKIVIHFPLALLMVCWVTEAAWVFRAVERAQKFSRTLFPWGLGLLLLAYVSGQVSSRRTGISLQDPAWVSGNLEIAAGLINHRGMALFTVVLFLSVALFRVLERHYPMSARKFTLIGFLAFTLSQIIMIATAHFGANLQL